MSPFGSLPGFGDWNWDRRDILPSSATFPVPSHVLPGSSWQASILPRWQRVLEGCKGLSLPKDGVKGDLAAFDFRNDLGVFMLSQLHYVLSRISRARSTHNMSCSTITYSKKCQLWDHFLIQLLGITTDQWMLRYFAAQWFAAGHSFAPRALHRCPAGRRGRKTMAVQMVRVWLKKLGYNCTKTKLVMSRFLVNFRLGHFLD